MPCAEGREVISMLPLTIFDLRRAHPDWEWRAERFDVFHGRLGNRQVYVYSADDIGGEPLKSFKKWLIRESGETVTRLEIWSAREGCKRPQ